MKTSVGAFRAEPRKWSWPAALVGAVIGLVGGLATAAMEGSFESIADALDGDEGEGDNG